MELALLPGLEADAGRSRGLGDRRDGDARTPGSVDLGLDVRRGVLAVVDVEVDLMLLDLLVDQRLVGGGRVTPVADRIEERRRGEQSQPELVGEWGEDRLRGADRGAG